MRILVFFDLPTETPEDRTNYRHFRTGLIKNGFIMLQESVYCRLLIAPSQEKAVVEAISKQKPPKGLVQLLTVTEKQFSKMVYLVGETHSDILSTEDRVVIF